MTTDIQKAGAAALIDQGMESGAFVDVENLLIEALNPHHWRNPQPRLPLGKPELT